MDEKKRILIVDDERDALFILEKELAARGYSVITADNGNDAITLARSKHPDLIIFDVAMPDMDGGQVAGKLQEGLLTKDIPIIFLTALFPKTKEEEQRRVLAGHVFIAKPYDIEELAAQMEKLILGHPSELQSSHSSNSNRTTAQ
ncbi:MAG: response regulator [Phycisphaerae bacterium]